MRDLYLGREVDDFDLVTDATTESLKQIFPEAILVGESFGVLKIPVSNGELFDLATFREESDYVDGRRPSAVIASTPIEDAKRRDFTINALFWDDENQRLIDLVGGVHDLNQRILSCVGQPEIRFEEDHLRIVRLIRFAAQLHFDIQNATEAAAIDQIAKVKRVSGERIWIELKKIAQARHWDFVLKAKLFNLLINEIFELSREENHSLINNKLGNILKVENYEIETLLFVLMNLHADSGKLKTLLVGRLKLSRSEMATFELIQYALNKLKEKTVFELCLEIEKKPGLHHVLRFLAQLKFFNSDIISHCEMILAQHAQPLVTGQQLLSILVGPEIGKALDEVRLLQFQGEIKTEAEALQRLHKAK